MAGEGREGMGLPLPRMTPYRPPWAFLRLWVPSSCPDCSVLLVTEAHSTMTAEMAAWDAGPVQVPGDLGLSEPLLPGL